MSDGLSDYWADRFRRVSPRSEPPEISEVRAAKPVAEPWTRGEYAPIVPRQSEAINSFDRYSATTRIGDKVTLNNTRPWQRNDFAYLGVIHHQRGGVSGFAWHADGRSIDRDDRGYDLVDFPPKAKGAPSPYFWLGKDAE